MGELDEEQRIEIESQEGRKEATTTAPAKESSQKVAQQPPMNLVQKKKDQKVDTQENLKKTVEKLTKKVADKKEHLTHLLKD